jgi:toxin ParE1/3/4
LLISTERSLSGSIGDSEYRLVVENPGQRIGEIIIALDVLEHNPLIGRPVANGKRELVIGRRAQRHLARYRYLPEIEIVFVLAIRSHREAGYAERVEEG